MKYLFFKPYDACLAVG